MQDLTQYKDVIITDRLKSLFTNKKHAQAIGGW